MTDAFPADGPVPQAPIADLRALIEQARGDIEQALRWMDNCPDKPEIARQALAAIVATLGQYDAS